MKYFLLLAFVTTAHSQIFRPLGPAPQGPTRGANYSDARYRGPNAPVERPRVPRVGTSPSNHSDPKPKSFDTAPVTATGIVLDSSWKISLNDFALKNVVHASWGYSHGERNFHTTLLIAAQEGIAVDEDVLFASSLLHDLGGLPGFEVAGVDHGLRSAELALPLLRTWGFPEQKLELVKELIIGHVYYGPAPLHPLAQAFRDADMLDFLGPMGVARLLAATPEIGTPPSISTAVAVIKKMEKDLPKRFSYHSSTVLAERRKKLSRKFLESLESFSFSGKAY